VDATTTITALHTTTSSRCGEVITATIDHSKNHNSNHLSVHQWVRSAIRDLQQPSSAIGFLF
jgi:hypothetical protein